MVPETRFKVLGMQYVLARSYERLLRAVIVAGGGFCLGSQSGKNRPGLVVPGFDHINVAALVLQLTLDGPGVEISSRHRRHPVVMVAEQDPSWAQEAACPATNSAMEPWIGSPSIFPRPAAARMATSGRRSRVMPVQ